MNIKPGSAVKRLTEIKNAVEAIPRDVKTTIQKATVANDRTQELYMNQAMNKRRQIVKDFVNR